MATVADPQGTVERVIAASNDFMAVIGAEPISTEARARIAFAAGAFASEALKAGSAAYREMAWPLDALTSVTGAHLGGTGG